MKRFALCSAIATASIFAVGVAATQAHSAESASLQVKVIGVANAKGRLMVAVCDRSHFLKSDCPYRGSFPAHRGTMSIRLPRMRPGMWAVEVVHDENGNGRLDRNGLGIPVEGAGFSKDARNPYGPPTFDAAMVSVTGPTKVELHLTY